MSEEIDRQEVARKYLLGALSEEEKTRFEEEYFLDDAEFEQLEISEDELIERYVRDELSADDARHFEKLLALTGISERVEVARLIAKRAAVPVRQVETRPARDIVKPSDVSWWDRFFGPAETVRAVRPAFAFSLILLLLTTTALVFVWTKLRAESQRLAQEQQQREDLRRQIEEQKARSEGLKAELDKTQQEREQQAVLAAEYKRLLAEQQQRSVPAAIFPFVLGPGGGSRGTGGSAISDLKIPPGVSLVGFSLNVTHGGDDYLRYNAVLRNRDTSQRIATKPNLKPVTESGRKYIRFNVDAKALLRGSYSIKVDGITAAGQAEDFDEYNFRVNSR